MADNKKAGYFPVLINLNNFPCLIVGSGEVALRKALSLLNFNADITVISPRISKHLLKLSKNNKIKIIKKNYSKKYLKNFRLVFCATNCMSSKGFGQI